MPSNAQASRLDRCRVLKSIRDADIGGNRLPAVVVRASDLLICNKAACVA